MDEFKLKFVEQLCDYIKSSASDGAKEDTISMLFIFGAFFLSKNVKNIILKKIHV